MPSQIKFGGGTWTLFGLTAKQFGGRRLEKSKSKFYLVYGMNVNTGSLGWYRYDSKDKTLQRYETQDLENLSILNNKYLVTIAILSTSILMLMLFLLILFNRIKNMKQLSYFFVQKNNHNVIIPSTNIKLNNMYPINIR